MVADPDTIPIDDPVDTDGDDTIHLQALVDAGLLTPGDVAKLTRQPDDATPDA